VGIGGLNRPAGAGRGSGASALAPGRERRVAGAGRFAPVVLLIPLIMPRSSTPLFDQLDAADPSLYDVATTAAGPSGSLPLSESMLRDWSSGDLFGLSQNAGMGWEPSAMLGPQFLLLSTQGGIRAPDGVPVALGYHTGHWEVGLLVQEAARVLK